MGRVWFSRNWHQKIVIGVAVISFLVYLGWKLGIATSFAVLSIFVSAFFAARSLKLTQNSLTLTRATTRPFLSVAESVSCHMYTTSVGRIITIICNKGVFPADQVSVECELLRIGRVPKTLSLLSEHGKKYPSICFPDDNIEYRFERIGITAQRDDELRVRIIVNYKNKLTQETHKTVRAFSMIFSPSDMDVTLPPYPEEDYWN